MRWFSALLIVSCFVFHLLVWNAKADHSIDAALSSLVMFCILMQHVDVIAEKSRFFGFRMMLDFLGSLIVSIIEYNLTIHFPPKIKGVHFHALTIILP